MQVVLDSDVLISALCSADENPASAVSACITGRCLLCYDARILREYEKVLRRPAFGFSDWQVKSLLTHLEKNGFSIVADPLPGLSVSEEGDRKFFEVAKSCYAPLITKDTGHFPEDSLVTSVSDFCSDRL